MPIFSYSASTSLQLISSPTSDLAGRRALVVDPIERRWEVEVNEMSISATDSLVWVLITSTTCWCQPGICDRRPGSAGQGRSSLESKRRPARKMPRAASAASAEVTAVERGLMPSPTTPDLAPAASAGESTTIIGTFCHQEVGPGNPASRTRNGRCVGRSWRH